MSEFMEEMQAALVKRLYEENNRLNAENERLSQEIGRLRNPGAFIPPVIEPVEESDEDAALRRLRLTPLPSGIRKYDERIAQRALIWECTKCGARPKKKCRTPKGTKLRDPHRCRLDAALGNNTVVCETHKIFKSECGCA